MKNETKLTKKVAEIFIHIGELHANSISFGTGYYEPKISERLLKNSKKSDK